MSEVQIEAEQIVRRLGGPDPEDIWFMVRRVSQHPVFAEVAHLANDQGAFVLISPLTDNGARFLREQGLPT